MRITRSIIIGCAIGFLLCLLSVAVQCQVILSGRVIDQDDSGIANVSLSLTGHLDNPTFPIRTIRTRTNSFGYYQFEQVFVGTHILMVSAKGKNIIDVVVMNDNVTRDFQFWRD
jgi:hypothetical protein